MALISLGDIQAVKPDADVVKTNALIDDALGLAYSIAPCLFDEGLDENKAKAARAVLRSAVCRWLVNIANPTVTQQSVGPYSWDVDSSKGNLFWPSEITQLQNICKTSSAGQTAFAIDMVPEFKTSGHWVDTTTWVAGE